MGNPSPEEVELFMQTEVAKIRQKTSEGFADKAKSAAVFSALKAFKVGADSDSLVLSRPSLVASYLYFASIPLFWSNALIADDEENLPAARFHIDFSIALGNTLAAVLLAEGDIRGDSDAATTAFLDEQEQLIPGETPLTDSLEEYIGMRRMLGEYGALLQHDPTGFSTVDDYVNYASQLDDESAFCREYFKAGAEFGGYLYKMFYEIAEPLYPNQPPLQK